MAELFRVKISQFLDSRKICDPAAKATASVFTRMGGLVRLIARRSIRKRKGISSPGQPPSSHTDFLKDEIFYGVERAGGEAVGVVIGPSARFRGAQQTPGAPEALEFGGTVRRGSKRYDYDERPFMGPALIKAEPKFPEAFKDSISGKVIGGG